MPVADLDHKVRACAVTFCNSETLIQICMIYAVVSDSGLHKGIVADIGLSVEMKMCGGCMGLFADSTCIPCILKCLCFN